MTRFHLRVEYDGRDYVGWQRQAHGASIQQAIEEAVLAAFGESVAVHAAGRTDAGVHAEAMSAHVDIVRGITGFRLAGAINAHLRPRPIAVLDATEVPDDWHARFTCTGRAYRYRIINRRARLALEEGRAWHVAERLDADAMDAAAQRLVGRHDFTTFRSAHCQADNPVRTLDRLDVTREGDAVTIRAAARSFLHHQVRSMVGCLALVGRGRWSADDLRAALEARDRHALGLNAPPDGLYFVGASYP
ncbi:MAG: tRNA pseudouridine(38-40) synthase [uncultured Sphingomonadaceae bacterium]|uniref:tRNA pseudouridine synthase A n=1 Tax=uncultured Sphingomonadaceae bacterium TaxID=169976 RepID=A0A6J4S7K9_9SPHN|nr:MAG: tRNA pseudouridine(38-40) synthase [uncultured Sphingomonadaceae bacterium]